MAGVLGGDYRKDVASRVCEPRDVGAIAHHHAIVVLRHAGVASELHSPAGQLAHGRRDVIDGKVEDSLTVKPTTSA